jgi:hypothetical protein
MYQNIPTIKNPNNNNDPTIKQSTGCGRLKIMPPTNSFKPQPF